MGSDIGAAAFPVYAGCLVHSALQSLDDCTLLWPSFVKLACYCRNNLIRTCKMLKIAWWLAAVQASTDASEIDSALIASQLIDGQL